MRGNFDSVPDTDLIARLIFKMLPHKPPYRLAMDRTNWKFGQTDINVLTLAIVYQGVAFPILISMLDKQGNSNTNERIAMINRYIRLFGHETIDCLLADREFVGEHWIKYLNRYKIRYYIRIRENFQVENPRTGKRLKAFWMFNNLLCVTMSVSVSNLPGERTIVLSVGFKSQKQRRKT